MKLKELLKGVAPIISGLVGTANPLAGMAVKVLCVKLLGKPDGTVDVLE